MCDGNNQVVKLSIPIDKINIVTVCNCNSRFCRLIESKDITISGAIVFARFSKHSSIVGSSSPWADYVSLSSLSLITNL